MSDIKKRLLAEISSKAERIKKKRAEAAGNKNAEAFVFEFFRQVDEANLQDSASLVGFIMMAAISSLETKVRSIDNGAKIDIVWLGNERSVQGVTIMWSPAYAKANNIDSSFYIDVGQMLFT